MTIILSILIIILILFIIPYLFGTYVFPRDKVKLINYLAGVATLGILIFSFLCLITLILDINTHLIQYLNKPL